MSPAKLVGASAESITGSHAHWRRKGAPLVAVALASKHRFNPCCTITESLRQLLGWSLLSDEAPSATFGITVRTARPQSQIIRSMTTAWAATRMPADTDRSHYGSTHRRLWNETHSASDARRANGEVVPYNNAGPLFGQEEVAAVHFTSRLNHFGETERFYRSMKRWNDYSKHRGNCTGQIPRTYDEKSVHDEDFAGTDLKTRHDGQLSRRPRAPEPTASAMIICTAVRAADYELFPSIEQPVEGS
ncbi:hypothetical protein V8C44DRAFT_127779 [Trichoderma aethiopicum]